MSGFIKTITDLSFEQDVIYSEKPVLVDFWAEWCGPCHTITPILEEVATVYSEQLTVAKINIDKHPQTPEKFGIKSIPTLILFKNGQVVGTKTGAISKSELSAFLENHLNQQQHYSWR